MTTALTPAVPAAAPASARFIEGLVTASKLGEQGAPMLDVARALVEGGWPVFPCGQDKAPLISGGFRSRECNAEKVRRWWTTHPNAMPAICPGDGGLAALDVDSTAAATAVREAGFSLSEGLIVETGGTSAPFELDGQQRKPMHVYIRATEQPKLPGVVARFRSGYVIAPGARRGERVYRVASSDEPAMWTNATKTTPVVQPAPAARLAQQAPDIERVRQAVACIPNTTETDRDDYVALAHRIKGAVGDAGRDIFLDWAAKYPGVVDPAEDERVFDTIIKPRTGWPELWHLAAHHGFDARPERLAEAQDDFDDEVTAPPPLSLAERLRVTPFGAVQDRRVEWLLRGRLARQQITMLNGWPGEGKTSVAIDLVAKLSRGQGLIDGTAPPRPLRVLICSTEDSQTVLKSRLRAAGADLDRVLTIPDTMLDHLRLPSRRQNWIDLVRDLQIDLVVVDPMMSFVDDNLKSIAEQDARKFALALRQVGEMTNAAALCIRHPNKATAGGHMNPVSAASGSLAFTAAARIELLVGRLPDSDDDRAVAHVKNNLSPPAVTLVYRINEAPLDFEDGADTVAAVEWRRVDKTVTAEDLLARRESREVRTQIAEAKAFLEKRLANGPVDSARVTAEAKRQGIAERTLRRAREEVGWSEYVGSPRYGGVAVWGLKTHTINDYKPGGETGRAR